MALFMRGTVRVLTMLLWLPALVMLSTVPAYAHDAPGGSELVLSDWTFYVFLTFGFAGLGVMILAYKTGHLFRIEDAKYPMLLIPEEDFYTPDWALAEEEEALS